MFETSSKPHPGLFFSFQAGLELLLDSFGYKGAQWDASLGGHRFGAAKDGVGESRGWSSLFQDPIFMGGS